MKILITGGIGFVGSRLLLLLQERDYKTIVIDKRNISDRNTSFKFYHGNICDLNALAVSSEGCDAIIHLAAEHKDNVKPVGLYNEVNVDGTRNVCLAADKNNIKKIIFTSSVAVYGLNTLGDELSEPAPFNEYGRTKFEAENILKTWQLKNSEKSVTIIRPTVIFGENNRGNVYNLLKQLAYGPFFMIGNGDNKKSLAYVGNVANFIVRCLEFGPGFHLFNYTDKPDLNMNDLVFHVQSLLGKSGSLNFKIPKVMAMIGAGLLDFISLISKKEFPISRVRVKKFTANTIYSSEGLDNICFKPPYDMTQALEKTIRHEFFNKQ